MEIVVSASAPRDEVFGVIYKAAATKAVQEILEPGQQRAGQAIGKGDVKAAESEMMAADRALYRLRSAIGLAVGVVGAVSPYADEVLHVAAFVDDGKIAITVQTENYEEGDVKQEVFDQDKEIADEI